MKEGWQIKTLGEVCEIITGTTPSTSNSQYWDGEIAWITPAELGLNSGIIKDSIRHITEKAVQDCSLRINPKGTVIFSSRAPIGKVGIAGNNLYCNQGFKNFLCSNVLYNQFLYYFLIFKREYLISLGTGATFKEVSKKVVSSVSIPIPSLSEQERIVGILDREFERIEAIKANAQQALQSAKDLFQSELRQALTPKDGWEVKSITEVATLKAGKFVSAKDILANYAEGLYPCYGGNGLRGYVKSFNHEGVYNLIGRQGALCGNINIASGKFHATEHAVVVTPKEPIVFKFLNYSLINANLNQYSTGAAQPGLSVENLNAKVSLALPPLSEQEAIVSRLDAVSATCKEIERNSQEIITQCEALKQSLLRKAFEGEL